MRRDKAGRITTNKPTRRWLAKRVSADSKTGCRNWQGARDKYGYGVATVDYERVRVHRLAWELVRGAIPADQCVLHKCDNPACVNVRHLFVGTQLDNIADKVAKGRQSRGARHSATIPHRRLTPNDVRAIRLIASSGKLTQRALASQFGVSESLISGVVHRTRWSHVR